MTLDIEYWIYIRESCTEMLVTVLFFARGMKSVHLNLHGKKNLSRSNPVIICNTVKNIAQQMITHLAVILITLNYKVPYKVLPGTALGTCVVAAQRYGGLFH